jgi:mono/diheme cytochrome c family protein
MGHLLTVAGAISGSAVGGGVSEAAVSKGKTAYRQLCAQCHGPNMVSPGTSSFDLRTFPVGEFERFKRSVIEGKGDMPAWGDMLVPGELESLWAYVRARVGG